jgi:hypothetical protein
MLKIEFGISLVWHRSAIVSVDLLVATPYDGETYCLHCMDFAPIVIGKRHKKLILNVETG